MLYRKSHFLIYTDKNDYTQKNVSHRNHSFVMSDDVNDSAFSQVLDEFPWMNWWKHITTALCQMYCKPSLSNMHQDPQSQIRCFLDSERHRSAKNVGDANRDDLGRSSYAVHRGNAQ